MPADQMSIILEYFTFSAIYIEFFVNFDRDCFITTILDCLKQSKNWMMSKISLYPNIDVFIEHYITYFWCI